jgi:peptidoglycan LD-endopeptidase CwlK
MQKLLLLLILLGGSGESQGASVPTCVIHPELQAKVKIILAGLEAKGWQPRVAEGCRTLDQQKEKVRLGYSKTLNSKHLRGLAVDIIDKRYGWHGPAAKLSFQFWKDYGTLCKAQGLTWGGDWKSFPDVAHCQM